MSSTRSKEVADRVASKLTSKFYVGQKVKLTRDFHPRSVLKKGYTATVSKILEDENMIVVNETLPDASGNEWRSDWWEPA
jgi:hypothetical protein